MSVIIHWTIYTRRRTVRCNSRPRASGHVSTRPTVNRLTGQSGALHRIVQCPPEAETSQSGDSLSRLARVQFAVRCAPESPVHPRTEGNLGLPNGAPSSLWAIKGTPRRMEHYTKPPLNILQRLDFASTHSFHCERDLSTSLSCNSAALFCVLSF
jgi:hypothetical protein